VKTVRGTASKNAKTRGERKSKAKPRNKLCNIKLPPEVHLQLVAYKEKSDKTMIEVCGEAVNWFCKAHASKPTMMYLVEPLKHKLLQYWIPPAAYDNARMVAARDGVAIRNVVYTALVMFYDSEITGEKLFRLS